MLKQKKCFGKSNNLIDFFFLVIVEKFEDAAAIIREFGEIIQIKKTNIIRITYQQGKVFRRFKQREKFIEMVKKFNVNKSTVTFQITVLKLIDKYPIDEVISET